MVLRKIFGPKGKKVTEKRRKLYREELYDLYSSPDTIKIIKSTDETGEARVTYRAEDMHTVFWLTVWKKRPLVRPRRRWENNIKVDLTEKGWSKVDWIHVDRDKDRWCTCEHGNENSGFIKVQRISSLRAY
jgi:hypothetical protein